MRCYLVIALTTFGVATTAGAQAPGPEDLTAVANNLGPTVSALAEGLGDTTETLISTQSAVDTSGAVGDTVVNTTQAAIDGAPNLAAFGLVAGLGNGAVQDLLNPALTAVDNPTMANIQAALAPEDLTTITENLETTPRALLEGNDLEDGLRQAGIDMLEGNLTEGLIGGALPQGGAVYNGGAGFAIGTQELVNDTNFEPVGQLVALGALVVPVAGEPVLAQLDGPASQLADAGAPLTDPVKGILEAGF